MIESPFRSLLSSLDYIRNLAAVNNKLPHDSALQNLTIHLPGIEVRMIRIHASIQEGGGPFLV